MMADINHLDKLQRPDRVLVVVLPGVHALDFGGPVQAIYEANFFGADYDMGYYSDATEVRAAQGYLIGDLKPLPQVNDRDWVIVPGTDSRQLDSLRPPLQWLRDAVAAGARITSVCSGAFVLAKAGVLDGRQCTSHWRMIERLRRDCPRSEVLANRLYVRDGNIFTSAGEASGIDMTLSLIESDYGARLASQVAREMVVYIRRSGDSTQRSAYLEHRSHIHPAVHRVQDWIIEHPDENATIDDLSEVAALSPRHLTRVFRNATGVTLKAFSHLVKLEVAQNLLRNRELTVEDVAAQCGFQNARQLRRLWRLHFDMTLVEWRLQQRDAA